MSDLAKLKAALRRTAADGVTGQGVQRFDSPEAGVALILDAIDGAFLGRRLTCALEGGATLVLEASARRLLRVSAPPVAGLAPGAELRPGDAQAVAAALLAACRGARGLQMSDQPIAEGTDPSEGGIPPDHLRAALGLSPQAPAPGVDDGIDAFVAELSDRLRAALWIEGEEVALVAGDQARAGALSQWAAPMLERLLAPEFPLAAALETHGVMVFAMPDAARTHTLIAGRLGAFLVAEISGADPSPTIAAWRAVWV